MNTDTINHHSSIGGASDERLVRKVVLPGQTPDGQHILSVLVKRSYKIIPGKQCARAESDRKLHAGDVYYQDPMNSSVRYESDFVPFKIATDVVLNGRAQAVKGEKIDQFTASLIIGQHRKDILVIGDRVCRYQAGRDPIFSEPEPFTAMEIRYERAYGGVDIWSDPKVPCIYPRNHLGRGYVIKNDKRPIDNLALPNLEDPRNRLIPAMLATRHFVAWERQPMPQSFGWVSKIWRPRSTLAGVMPADRQVEQELRKIYASIVPPAQKELYEQTQLPDMDFRFFNGASDGLALPFLSGDEDVRLINLDPDGEMSFKLPGDRPGIGLDLGGGMEEPPSILHTVMIDVDQRQVDLVWRGAVPYPGPDWLPGMRKMEVAIQ
jgi:hypothetical protein